MHIQEGNSVDIRLLSLNDAEQELILQTENHVETRGFLYAGRPEKNELNNH